MKQSEIKHFKELLEKELARLDGELRTVGQKNSSNPNDWEPIPPKNTIIDPADDMEIAEKIDEYEDNTAILKQLEIRYNDIKAALARIKSNSFGLCTVCGEVIEAGRLEANPAATTCMKHL